MALQYSITISAKPKGFHIITDEVVKLLPDLPECGVAHIFIKHTSAGLAINENADSTVRKDLNLSFDTLAPENQEFYEHTMEGPDDMPAHIKSILVGSSVMIPIAKGQLVLGTWQGIYLCEFRNRASARSLVVTILS